MSDPSFPARYLKGFSKQTNRLLSSWVRGIIAERLSFKTALQGVKLVKVPAAYSSQRCPYCGCVCRESRKGDRFECVHCGAKGHADRVACLNLLCERTIRVSARECRRKGCWLWSWRSTRWNAPEEARRRTSTKRNKGKSIQRRVRRRKKHEPADKNLDQQAKPHGTKEAQSERIEFS